MKRIAIFKNLNNTVPTSSGNTKKYFTPSSGRHPLRVGLAGLCYLKKVYDSEKVGYFKKDHHKERFSTVPFVLTQNESHYCRPSMRHAEKQFETRSRIFLFKQRNYSAFSVVNHVGPHTSKRSIIDKPKKKLLFNLWP